MEKSYLQKLVNVVKEDVSTILESESRIPHRFWSEFDDLLDIEMAELLQFSNILEKLSGFDEKEIHQKLVDEIFTLFEQKIDRHLSETTIPKRLYSKVYQIIDDANVQRNDYKDRVEYRIKREKDE